MRVCVVDPQARQFIPCFANAVNSTLQWKECARDMSQVCRRGFPVTAIKTIRLTLNRALEVMRGDPKVKVVHLFRDPRAVLLSRHHLGFAKWSDLQNESQTWCRRMSRDLETTKVIQADLELRSRYVIVRYEDITVAPVEAVQRMFEFMGLQPSKEELRDASEMILGGRKNQTSFEVGAAFVWALPRSNMSLAP